MTSDREALRGLVGLIRQHGDAALLEAPAFAAAREALDEADGEPCVRCGAETLLDLSVRMGESYSGRCTSCGATFWGSQPETEVREDGSKLIRVGLDGTP